MFQAIWVIAEGLSGAFGFIILLYLTAWLVTRHDHDHEGYGDSINAPTNPVSELEQAKETFALTGSRDAYRRMLSLVTAPDVLTWYNSADEDEAAKRTGIRVVDDETQAMWSDIGVELTELRIALSPYPCNCSTCKSYRREDHDAWLLARDAHNRSQVGGTSPRAQRISPREWIDDKSLWDDCVQEGLFQGR
jgi:hypothetical protein